MKKKYNQAMERIEITDEMRERILNNIQKVNLKEITPTKMTPFLGIKKYLSVAACFAIILIGSITILNLFYIEQKNNPDVTAPGSDIIEVSSAHELTEIVGFEVKDVPNLPFEATESIYTAYWTEMGEIYYSSEDKTAVFRKSTGNEDNSGDYNSYYLVKEFSIGSCSVILKGNNNVYALALWSDGEFSYSLNLSDGISENEWSDIISEICSK